MAVDTNGVTILYAAIGSVIDFGPLSERGGTRADLSNPPLNCEFTGYFSGGGSDDNAAKLRGSNHSDGEECNGCCYIPACPSDGGSPRYRTECPHPSGYEDCPAETSGSCPSFSGFNGMKAVVWNTANNCVHWELWVDSTGTAPGNWTKVMQTTDCEGQCSLSACGGGPLLRPRGGTHQFTWRCDGGPDSKWMTAVEIQPGVSGPTGGAPIPGGGGVPPSGDPNGNMGDGGGGGGNDNDTGSGGGASAFAGKGCAIATAGGNTVVAGKCGGTGEDILPGVGAGGAGGATEPKPLVTVFKDVGLLYNIRVDLFDNCTVTGDPNVTDFKEIYNVSPIQNEYKSLFQNSTIAYYGVKLHSSQSVLYKKKIRKVAVTLKRENPDPVVLAGEIKMEIRDIMGNVIYEFEDTYDPATIELSDTVYEFESLDNTHKLEAGDSILLSYANGGDTGNHIKVAHCPQEAIDGFNSVAVESASGISFDVDQLADFAAVIYT